MSGTNMSGSSSDWSHQLREDKRGPIAEALLSGISEIIKSVICIQTEKEIFTEIGCYFYRASMIIMELHTNWNTPTNTVEILQSLCKRVELAKTFTTNLQNNAHNIQSSEIVAIVQQLEGVVRSIGENLGLLPISTYGDQEYADKAAKSLSKEMKDVSFSVGPSSRGLEVKEQLHHSRETVREEMETDLYSVDADISAMNLQLSDTSQIYSTYNTREISTDNIREISNNNSREISAILDRNNLALPQLARYMEPLYDTFYCPLTKTIMDDPVTVESGVTYDRKAISNFFDKIDDQNKLVCPKSGQKINSRNLSTNVALKATIDEWKERNEAARIKVARAALSLASSDNMILEAIDDLQTICKTKPYNKVQIRSVGMIPLLAKFLEYRSRSIRQATLELLRQLAEDDQEGKDIVAKTVDISTVLKMLSSSHTPIRHASALLLLELSTSRLFCNEIGAVAGGILMLTTVKYRQPLDSFASEKAHEILKNLEKLPDNIKLMAENGYWEPLLTHLLEGNEEMKIEMANYLGEIILGSESKTYVAERASPALIQMVHSANPLSKNAAFKALKQISSHHPNAKTLVEAGIMQIMVEEMFTRRNEAALILANILESGLDLENCQVSAQGHTLASDYIVYNIIHRIKNSTPDELNINLIRILLCLVKFTLALGTIVSVVKEMEAGYNLIELINNPNEELGIVSIKLLITLSGYMGHTLSDNLCKTQGQPRSLILNPSEITVITEKHAVSANFLAKLPHQNLTLNLALVNSYTVETVMRSISQIHKSGTRSSRHTSAYFEGLVGILVRLTTTLFHHQILLTAKTYNFASVLTELLTRSFTDEVQKLSAIGLENLSRQTVALSRPPQRKKTKILKLSFFRKCISINLSKDENFSMCPIHRGVCSSQETFCLIDAEAVERLLACLDHENVEVIEAALSALSTLLDDKVDVDKSVSFLSEKHAIRHVLNVVKEHKEEAITKKAFWVIERFLMKGGDNSVSDISQDRLLTATLVSAFQHGEDSTRDMAGKILRHLNKMPDLSNTLTFTK